MTASRLWSALALLMVLSVPAHARTGQPQHLNFKQALHAINDFSIPAAYAGVWTYPDTLRDCDTGDLLEDPSTGSDTLCAGDTASPGGAYQCTGTITDTQADLVCEFSYDFVTCAVHYSEEIHITRTGDTARLHTITRTTYVPTMCALQPDTCEDEWQTLTRTAPPPIKCATPTRRESWGKLKLLYR